jgi:hypothetical protein
LDLFGAGFVLVCHAESENLSTFEQAFEERGIPFSSITLDVPEVYERPFVLVRPDGHVAWRGHELPADAGAIADQVRGGAR